MIDIFTMSRKQCEDMLGWDGLGPEREVSGQYRFTDWQMQCCVHNAVVRGDLTRTDIHRALNDMVPA